MIEYKKGYKYQLFKTYKIQTNIKPPKNIPEGQIIFNVNIISDENVLFDDEILTISWKIPNGLIPTSNFRCGSNSEVGR